MVTQPYAPRLLRTAALAFDRIRADFPGPLRIVTMERGMRDMRLGLTSEAQRRGVSLEMHPIAIGTELIANAFRQWPGGEARGMVAHYLDQNHLHPEKILADGKPVMLLDTAHFGRVIRDVREFLVQSLAPAGSQETFLQSVMATARRKKVLVLFGTGGFDFRAQLRQHLGESDSRAELFDWNSSPLEQSDDYSSLRGPIYLTSFAETLQRVVGYMGERVGHFDANNIAFVNTGADPHCAQSQYVEHFMGYFWKQRAPFFSWDLCSRRRDPRQPLILSRPLNAAQRRLHELLPLRLLRSGDPHIRAYFPEGSAEAETAIESDKNTPQFFKAVNHWQSVDGRLVPHLQPTSHEEQAAAARHVAALSYV